MRSFIGILSSLALLMLQLPGLSQKLTHMGTQVGKSNFFIQTAFTFIEMQQKFSSH